MVHFFCFLLSFFYVQRPGGRGLGGRVQSGDDLSVACGDSSPGRGAFSFRCGGDDLSGAAAPAPLRKGSLFFPLRRGDLSGAAAPAPLRKGSQGAYRNFLLRFLQKEKRGYPLLAVHGADDVANTTCALILAQLAVKRKKFYWNLTFFDFSWYMSHGV